jgi:hypothetical protein
LIFKGIADSLASIGENFFFLEVFLLARMGKERINFGKKLGNFEMNIQLFG